MDQTQKKKEVPLKGTALSVFFRALNKKKEDGQIECVL